jgi:hypothetical protein
MQVAYSGTSGRVPRYACVRAHHLHGTDHSCQSVGGVRLERAITAAFLDAITPAGIRASAQAIEEIEQQHDERLVGQRLAVERGEFEAGRARRQFDACEPEHRLVARTLEARLEIALEELERERRKLAELERRRPEPLTPAERDALSRIARDLPRLWNATTTTPRDRKELLRTLITEITLTVREEPRRAEIEILWEGGARSELQIRLARRGAKRTCTPEDTVELIRRLAEHHPTGRSRRSSTSRAAGPGTGLLFSEPRVKYVRQQNEIPAAPPVDPASGIFTIDQAALELGVAETTIYRWLRAGLLPGEQTTPHAPWRIRLTPEVRSRFVPEVPDGFLPLDAAAKALGVARQTVLHKVERGELHAVQVMSGRRKGLRIQVSNGTLGLTDQ